MAERKWHLEHADGREWAQDELDEIVRACREHDEDWPYDVRCYDVAINTYGCVVLNDNFCTWHQPYIAAERDMEVVWDE